MTPLMSLQAHLATAAAAAATGSAMMMMIMRWRWDSRPVLIGLPRTAATVIVIYSKIFIVPLHQKLIHHAEAFPI